MAIPGQYGIPGQAAAEAAQTQAAHTRSSASNILKVAMSTTLPKRLPFRCAACGHIQQVSVVYRPDGGRLFGSGANWCDACGDGKPELMDQNTSTEIVARHSALRNIGLENCQTQLQVAIGHLHTLLNSQRTAVQSWEAEKAARDWLESIGSEPK